MADNGRTSGGVARGQPPAVVGALLAATLLLVSALLPGAVAVEPRAPRSLGTVTATAGGGPSPAVQAGISWDGTPIGDASSPSTAFTISPGQTASVNFSFVGAPSGPPTPTASLTLWFFGVPLSAVTVPSTVVAGVGSAVVNWSFGGLYELTEGVYRVDAQLTDASGNLLVNQSFYVDAKAPYVIGSAIAGFATVLAVLELYWIATAIQWRRQRRRVRRR